MALTPAPIQERRGTPRNALAHRLGIQLFLRADRAIPADSVNVSDGGLCLRLQETLEVRSLVRLQLIPEGTDAVRLHPVQCTGRVAWVVQRLDLRHIPPFLFDVGIEFIDPPPLVRQLLSLKDASLTAQAARARALDPCVIHDRPFQPQLERESGRPLPWHLIVSVEGVPCFSGRYPSQRAALAAWATFKRAQAKR